MHYCGITILCCDVWSQMCSVRKMCSVRTHCGDSLNALGCCVHRRVYWPQNNLCPVFAFTHFTSFKQTLWLWFHHGLAMSFVSVRKLTSSGSHSVDSLSWTSSKFLLNSLWWVHFSGPIRKVFFCCCCQVFVFGGERLLYSLVISV